MIVYEDFQYCFVFHDVKQMIHKILRERHLSQPDARMQCCDLPILIYLKMKLVTDAPCILSLMGKQIGSLYLEKVAKVATIYPKKGQLTLWRATF